MKAISSAGLYAVLLVTCIRTVACEARIQPDKQEEICVATNSIDPICRMYSAPACERSKAQLSPNEFTVMYDADRLSLHADVLDAHSNPIPAAFVQLKIEWRKHKLSANHAPPNTHILEYERSSTRAQQYAFRPHSPLCRCVRSWTAALAYVAISPACDHLTL